MKLIVVGATGFIGGEVLRQALLNDSITSIVALTRRDLPGDVSGNAKLRVVKMENFESYPDSVLQELAGAELCIWTMGGRSSKFPDLAAARKSNIDNTLAGARALADHVAPSIGQNRKFRFLYCSGAFTERDGTKPLYFMQDSRRIKGEAENGLLDIERQSSETFELLIARPAGVLVTNQGIKNAIMGPLAIGVEELGIALVDIALHGADGQITENNDLRARGRRLLKASK